MPSINSPARPKLGPSPGPRMGRAWAGPLIEDIDVNPTLVDVHSMLKYLETKIKQNCW